MLSATLHRRLKEHGVKSLGARHAIIGRLTEQTEECLEKYLAERQQSLAEAAEERLPTYSYAQARPPSSGQRYVVVHSPLVYIRESRDANSRRLGYKSVGDEVVAERDGEVDGWLKLSGEPGWMLRDGSAMGLGELLKPAPPVPSAGDSALPAAAAAAVVMAATPAAAAVAAAPAAPAAPAAAAAAAAGEAAATALAAPSPSTVLGADGLPPVIVMATDGLCNRLRVTLSYAAFARSRARPLLVVWPIANVCPGEFTEAFAPLAGVVFCEQPPAGLRAAFCPASHNFHPEVRAGGEAACTACYAALRPSAAVAARVEANLAALGADFLSLHVRRTDHWGSTATDNDYAAFIDRHAPADVYLATDNAQTQAGFMRSPAHGHRIKALTAIAPDESRLRQTSLADAAVDLFTCAAAGGPFKGCYTSSFSDTIVRLRALAGKAHAADEHVLTDADAQMAVTLHTPGGHLQHSPGQPMESHSARPSPPKAASPKLAPKSKPPPHQHQHALSGFVDVV